MSELNRLAVLLESVFEGYAWHGPSVMDVLKDVDPGQAVQKLNGSHSIVELVGHMTAWRKFVINKLRKIDFEMTEELNFPSSPGWAESLASLKSSQRDLIEAIQGCPASRLPEIVPGRSYNYHMLINGIIHHDIYHLGQIVLLKQYAFN